MLVLQLYCGVCGNARVCVIIRNYPVGWSTDFSNRINEIGEAFHKRISVARIIQALNVEWSVKQKIHEDNWELFVTDEYGLSDYIPSMIMDSCTTENDFNLIEKLASEELQKRKAQADEDGVSEIVDILLDLYEKKKDREKFLLLCEKEFKHSYLRYIENLEAEGNIQEASQCCTRALEFASGFMKTELIEKLGDLKHAQRSDRESLSLVHKRIQG